MRLQPISKATVLFLLRKTCGDSGTGAFLFFRWSAEQGVNMQIVAGMLFQAGESATSSIGFDA